MGYTHYWEISTPLTKADISEYAADVRAIVLASGLPIAGWDGYDKPEYGPSRIALNGDRHKNGACETFGIEAGQTGFNFCKTRQLPYDVVVTAALLALHDRHPSIRLSSDGDAAEWHAGYALAERATGRTILWGDW